MKLKKRGIGIALSYTNTFLNMITGLFLSSFLIAQLGDESYGVYQSVSSFVNYLVLLEFGTGTIMSRNLAACKARGEGQEEIEKKAFAHTGCYKAPAQRVEDFLAGKPFRRPFQQFRHNGGSNILNALLCIFQRHITHFPL